MLSALVGLVAAAINTGMVSLSSPHLRLHNLQIAAATAYVDVDPPVGVPSLSHGSGASPFDLQTFTQARRASRPNHRDPARSRPDRIALRPAGRTSSRGSAASPRMSRSRSLSRTARSVPATSRRRLRPTTSEVEARPTLPIIDVYAQASSLARQPSAWRTARRLRSPTTSKASRVSRAPRSRLSISRRSDRRAEVSSMAAPRRRSRFSPS